MTYDADGYATAGPPPPHHGPPAGHLPPPYPGYAGHPGYPPPGYPGYPPPGYGPPGYPPNHSGAPGFSPYGGAPQPWQPGVIPLRPLSLSDIFNGAVAYIRRNPAATLGLTTIVVVIGQVLALLLQIGPLAADGGLQSALQGDAAGVDDAVLVTGSTMAALIPTVLASIVLSGMLTVVIGRAVFGAGITIGEAWQRLRGRLPALIGFTLLQGLAFVFAIFLIVVIIVAAAAAGGAVAGFLVGAPLVLAGIAGLIFAATVLLFAPALIVLERLAVWPAVVRSYHLVKRDFWRVLGIWLLAGVVTSVIAGAVSIPFSVVGQLLTATSDGFSGVLIGLVLVTIGGIVGQILTAPFSAGVTVLLYTDRRIRGEAFDLILRTGAATPPGSPEDATDHLWLTR